MTPKVAKN